ncbi:MAG TPA: tRNA (adenosine(37)-N6)-threonylcarbamoyltransferase complex transferase subunit TsaD [Actinomycetota bacterium]|nr:tRNA (adenosine(37)-N6)-threonylcarbamoyltransferase complex transferase subunit TsaD [Actinomycetota bacterium]
MFEDDATETRPQESGLDSREQELLVLGIETSCDETSVAILSGSNNLLGQVISSSSDLHQRFGGVVPEVASRAHVQAINPAISEALRLSGVAASDLDAVAVTVGPGLVGSLVVGVAAAKSLSAVLEVPLVGVNHLEAHLYANFLEIADLPLPALGLIVSGGHTMLVNMVDHGIYEVVGQTLDDAAGEAFDKVGRLLGLEFPGGPAIEREAAAGDPGAIAFPRAMKKEGFDFSFSGLKTAVFNYVSKAETAGQALNIPDICASFQEAVAEVLVYKTMRAAMQLEVPTIFLCGGVAANGRLRVLLSEACDANGVFLSIPAPVFCTDNAAMVACCGYYRFIRGIRSDLDVNPDPNLPLA